MAQQAYTRDRRVRTEILHGALALEQGQVEPVGTEVAEVAPKLLDQLVLYECCHFMCGKTRSPSCFGICLLPVQLGTYCTVQKSSYLHVQLCVCTVVLIIRLNFSRSQFTCFLDWTVLNLPLPRGSFSRPGTLKICSEIEMRIRQGTLRAVPSTKTMQMVFVDFTATVFVVNYFRNKERSFLSPPGVIACAIKSVYSADARI